MEKTDFSKQSKTAALVQDFTAMEEHTKRLEQSLKELRTILACICDLQDDKQIEVPFSQLVLVNNAQLAVGVDATRQMYVFKIVREEPAIVVTDALPPAANS